MPHYRGTSQSPQQNVPQTILSVPIGTVALQNGVVGFLSAVVKQVGSCSIAIGVPYPKLDVLKPGIRQYHKKPTAVREISEALTKQLQVELEEDRNKILAEKPCYRILGPQCICSDFVIQEICRRAEYVTTVDHLNIHFLRPELISRFYSVVMNTSM